MPEEDKDDITVYHNRLQRLLVTSLFSYPVTTVISSEAMDKIVTPAVTVCPLQVISCRRLSATVLEDAASNEGALESLPSYLMFLATGCCAAETIEKKSPRCSNNDIPVVCLHFI